MEAGSRRTPLRAFPGNQHESAAQGQVPQEELDPASPEASRVETGAAYSEYNTSNPARNLREG